MSGVGECVVSESLTSPGTSGASVILSTPLRGRGGVSGQKEWRVRGVWMCTAGACVERVWGLLAKHKRRCGSRAQQHARAPPRTPSTSGCTYAISANLPCCKIVRVPARQPT